jgi:hypothetical protein
MSKPSQDALAQALAAAGASHHEYEQSYLKGERDEQWAGYYAAHTLGRLGDFVAPSILAALLENAPAEDDWATAASAYILAQMAAQDA